MNSLSDLEETLKLECTTAYRSKVSFVISILKLQVKKLDLIMPYYIMMRAFQSSKGKLRGLVPPITKMRPCFPCTLIPFPKSKRACKKLLSISVEVNQRPIVLTPLNREIAYYHINITSKNKVG